MFIVKPDQRSAHFVGDKMRDKSHREFRKL